MANDKLNTWMIENKKKVSFQLDTHHKLYIERTQKGFTLKVFDERGREYRPNEPVLLYLNKISDKQLGHLEVVKE